MKKILILGLFFCAVISSAMATDDAQNDGNIVTSKLYVETRLSEKQDVINRPSDNGKVALYTNEAGTLDAKPVYDETGSYNTTQQDALIEAKNVNTAVQNGLNRHLTCRDWANNNQSSGDCWIWQINNLDGETFVPHTNP